MDNKSLEQALLETLSKLDRTELKLKMVELKARITLLQMNELIRDLQEFNNKGVKNGRKF